MSFNSMQNYDVLSNTNIPDVCQKNPQNKLYLYFFKLYLNVQKMSYILISYKLIHD